VQASDLAHQYLWNPAAVDQLLADEQVTSLQSPGTNLWALTDHLGSIRDVVDDAGTLRIHRDFDSFGNVVEETHYNATGTPVSSGTGYVDVAFGFTGRYLDDETGLQNNLNRWYDASTGQWISEDPIGFAAGDANLNRYVGNEPTMHVDPSGLKRRLCGWFSHGYIEVGDPDGRTYILSFGPRWGFEIFNSEHLIGLGAPWPLTGWYPSTPAEDEKLIELWKFLESERKAGRLYSWLETPVPYAYVNLLWNCWTPLLQFYDFGIEEGPFELKQCEDPNWSINRVECRAWHGIPW
jgi:RHS repeat-associated protein